ncbi:MAG: complex I subunit 1 family protein, partial [Polyangiaceae bacterium]
TTSWDLWWWPFPLSWWPLPETIQIATGLSGTFVAVVICSSALYAAMKVERGSTVGLRLAGTLHSVADAIKLIWKEDLRPRNADKLLYGLAPLLAMFPALVTFAVLPFGNTMCFVDTIDKATKKANGVLDFGELTNLASTVAANGQCAKGQIAVGLQVADLNVGLLYIFAIAGTGIIGAALAGWASDSKFALLGGLRATSQMVSYEVALGLSIVGMLMVTGSVHMGSIVDWQGANAWGIFVQPLGFLLFLTAVVAETKRVPFDQPEGESELVAGYFLEYSGMKFGLFFLGEYAEFVFSSALLVTLFFGGYHLPFIEPDGIRIVLGSSVIFEQALQHWAVTLIHVGAFFGKTIVVMWLHVFIRWTLPRFRYDQVMKLGWTKLLPLALVNILLTGIVLLGCMNASPRVALALDWAADLSQAFVALAAFGGVIWMITGLLEAPKRPTYRSSSSARYAAAAGGVKAGDMQA